MFGNLNTSMNNRPNTNTFSPDQLINLYAQNITQSMFANPNLINHLSMSIPNNLNGMNSMNMGHSSGYHPQMSYEDMMKLMMMYSQYRPQM
jgi:hypothetical protein